MAVQIKTSMSFALCYWILMLIYLVFGIGFPSSTNWKGHIPSWLLFILLILLGWRVFGPPIHS